MKAKVKITQKGKGLETLVRTFKQMDNAGVVVGVLSSSDKALDNGLTTLDIATFHEFGTERVMERSFIRQTVDDKRQDIAEVTTKLIRRNVDNEINLDRALGLLGEFVVSKIKDRITAKGPYRSTPEGVSPIPTTNGGALSPKTIARKGSSTPLVDTGQLINSIAYRKEGTK